MTKDNQILDESLANNLVENSDSYLVVATKDVGDRTKTELRMNGDIADAFIMLDIVISKVAEDLEEKPEFVLQALSDLMADGSYKKELKKID